MLDTLRTLIAAGGNSRAARSARAKLQWRDRYGRFIEMGRGIKFKVRFSDGTTKSITGKFVGAIDGETGQVYVQSDPNLPDGFYEVKSGNAQELIGGLSEEQLAKAGIELGKAADGTTIGDRADADIPNADSIVRSDAPEGWVVGAGDANREVWNTDDGDFQLQHGKKYDKRKRAVVDVWVVEDVANDKGRLFAFPEVGRAMKRVGELDARAGGADEATPDVSKPEVAKVDLSAPLKDRLAAYDPDGAAASLIDSGATGDAVLEELRKNPQWQEIENDLFRPADIRSAAQKERDKEMGALHAEVKALGTSTPEGSTPPSGTNNALDTDTFGVAKEGFVIPTGKRTDDSSPEGIAALIESEREYLSEGSGKRLVVDTDAGTAEIYNSADTLENAKAQAGGVGVAEYVDLATGEIISNDKNVGAPDGNTNPEGDTDPVEKFGPKDADIEARKREAQQNGITLTDAQARKQVADEAQAEKEKAPNDQSNNSDSGESKSDDSGADAPVDAADKPADSGTGADSTDSGDSGDGGDSADTERDALGEPFPGDRSGLEKRAAYLDRRVSNIDGESPLFEKTFLAQEQVQKRLADLDSAPEADDFDAERKRLIAERDQAKAELDAADKAETDAGDSADSAEQERTDLARENLNDIQAQVDNLEKKSDASVEELRKALETDAPGADRNAVEELTQRLDKLNQKFAETENAAALNRIETQIKDLEDRISAINTPATEAPNATDTPNTPGPDSGGDSSVDAPEPDSGGSVVESTDSGLSGRKIDRPVRWDALEAEGIPTPDLLELDSTSENAQKFFEAISKLQETNPFASSVHVYTPEEYADMRLFMTEDETAGAAITTDLERVSAFIHSDSPHKGGYRAIQSALINEGGTWSNGFDTVLPAIYAKEGVVPVARMRFDDEFAPEGWDYERYGKYNGGRPDVIFFGYDKSRIDSDYIPGEGVYVTDYDEGVALAKAGPTAPSESDPESPLGFQPGDRAANIADGIAENAPISHAKTSLVRNTLEGKDLPEDRKNYIQDRIEAGDATSAELADFESEIRSAPDKANQATHPRPSAEDTEVLTPVDAELIATESDPHEIVESDLVLLDVKRNHPDHTVASNGDIILTSKTTGNKRFDLVVRRTPSNRFFAYIVETNTATGERRAVRLQNETHSYKALRTKISSGKLALAKNKNTEAWVTRQKKVEDLGVGGELTSTPLRQFIDGTDIVATPDDKFNAFVAELASKINEGGHSVKVLQRLAVKNGADKEIVDQVMEAVKRRKIAGSNEMLAGDLADQPAHLSYDGEELEDGDWVDWTDTDRTIPQKDANGNTIYETDINGDFVLRPNGTKIALNKPNPNYGRVYRGQVKHLRYKAINSKGYAYGDNTLAVFEERNIELGGRKPSWQGLFVSSGMKKVSAPGAPRSKPFYPKDREAREQQKVAAEFGVPESGTTRTARPSRPAATQAEAEIDADTGIVSISDAPDVALPVNRITAARDGELSVPKSATGAELAPGDKIIRLNDAGQVDYETVLEVNGADAGRARVRTARPDDNGTYTVSEREFGPEKVIVLTGIFQDAPDIDRQRALLRDLLNERKAAPEARTEALEVLNDVSASPGDVADMIRKLETAKFAPYSKTSDDTVRGLAEAVGIDPETIDRGLAAKAQDRADVAAGVDYEGYPVRDIDFSEITHGSKNAMFDNIQEVFVSDLKVGDMLSRGVGDTRHFLQVVGTPSPANPAYSLRIISKDKGRAHTVNGYSYHVHGEVVMARLNRRGNVETNVKRPNENIPGDYFEDSSLAPEKPLAPRRGAQRYDDPTLVPENPNLLADLQAAGQAFVDEYLKGGSVTVFVPSEGYSNERAEIIRGVDGTEMFIKKASADPYGTGDPQNNELLANRIQNAIGIDAIQMGKVGDETLSTVADGDLGMTLTRNIPNWGDGLEMFKANNFWSDNDAWKVGLLDYLIQNPDRHTGNWFISSSGKITPIDHGHASIVDDFRATSPFAKALLRDIRNGSAPLTSAELMRIKANLQLLFPEFAKMNAKVAYALVLRRLNTLIKEVNNNVTD